MCCNDTIIYKDTKLQPSSLSPLALVAGQPHQNSSRDISPRLSVLPLFGSAPR